MSRRSKKNQGKRKRPDGAESTPPERDRDALREAFAGVRPLDTKSNKRVMPADPRPRTARQAERQRESRPDTLRLERHLDGSVTGQRAGTHSSILERLEDPGLEVDAECDLHRMTTSEADREVARFVRECQAAGDRWVLIIVGKGLHSPGGRATLREHIPVTLADRAPAAYVLAFRTAPRSLGGGGALTVRLRDRL
ncbi:MAG: Smr/MutS family protein [Myxococcota bacterium]